MIKHHGYLIEHRSGHAEKYAYDGHRSEGTGVFESWVDYRIVDPESAKALGGFDSEQQAKDYIERNLTSEGKVRVEQELEALNKLRAAIQDKDKELRRLRMVEANQASALPRKDWY